MSINLVEGPQGLMREEPQGGLSSWIQGVFTQRSEEGDISDFKAKLQITLKENSKDLTLELFSMSLTI